jgi:serine/threonine protein kinase
MKIIDPNNILTDKMKALIAQIPELERWECMKRLAGGFSGADVILGWATYKTGKQALVVAKFDEKSRIKMEKENWKRYVKGWLDRTNSVPINHSVEDSPMSLIVYECASFRAEIETFKHYYQRIINPEEAISHILNLLSPWYSNCSFQTEDLGGFIKGFLEKRAEGIEEELTRLKIDLTRLGIFIVELNRVLPNPLHKWDFSGNAIAPYGIIHGDLKAQNILLIGRNLLLHHPKDPKIELIKGRTREVCLIDYANTDIGNIFADLAELEASIKFQVMRIESINFGELSSFEDSILDNLQPVSKSSSAELQKAHSSISAIRNRAKEILKIEERVDEFSYWAHLYVTTMRHIAYRDNNTKQKLYALLSSALILEKQLSKEVKDGFDQHR